MQQPFDLLLDYDQRARNQAAGLPAQEDVKDYWSGVAFMLRGQRYVSPLDEVHEILHVPATVTGIPGTLPWVHGVANVRGRLLPLIDLGNFFGLDEVASSVTQRVLVLEQDDMYCGLIVDSVMGLQHFEVESYNNSIPATVPECMHFCMAGSYLREAEFLVLSFRALARREAFLQVSPASAVA